MPFLADDILTKTTSEKQLRYLKALYQETKTNLKKDESTDELMAALADHLKKKYKPEAVTPNKLLNLYQYLYAWRPNGVEMDAYIFTSVQGALLHIISEPLNEPLNKPLELMHQECLKYIKDLRQQLEKNPHNKQAQKKIDIVSAADEILQDEDYSNPIKATLFCELISDNQAIFIQDQHSRAMLFIKAVAVFMAFCLGAGIGGVFAYQKLFNQKDEEKTKKMLFNLSIFEPNPEQSLELEQEKNIKHKDSDSDIKP